MTTLHRFIKVNGSRVYLNNEAYDFGGFHVASFSVSDLCDACGKDIAETGCLNDPETGFVSCHPKNGGCGAQFPIDCDE